MSDKRTQPIMPGSLLSEGVGGGAPPRSEYVAVERCGSNPFGSNVRDEIVEAILDWLGTNPLTRNNPGTTHQLRKALTSYEKRHVFETVKANFHGSDRDDAKTALRAAGLLK
ncbi:hypothetical protein LCGC14_0583840 [marine sediment metagenome]|uniref:Uncharacterized protein n=1 Tax=marine sediment metagenome TaxID=412755 RepID=A0A0F9UNW5_9ZZZZ